MSEKNKGRPSSGRPSSGRPSSGRPSSGRPSSATISDVLGDRKHSLVRGLVFDLKAAGIPKPVLEHEFAKEALGRKWRFDLAWPSVMAACEVEGGTWGDKPSRHTTGSGFARDCVKYSEAAILGWLVVRVTADMLRDGTAVALVGRALASRRRDS